MRQDRAVTTAAPALSLVAHPSSSHSLVGTLSSSLTPRPSSVLFFLSVSCLGRSSKYRQHRPHLTWDLPTEAHHPRRTADPRKAGAAATAHRMYSKRKINSH